jgi:PAT family acetyl-CoA transporter-like MFS transporter 1
MAYRTRAHVRRNSSAADLLEGKLLGDYATDDDYDGDDSKSSRKKSGGFAKDYGSVALLLLLYTLQGVPMGLSASVSFILQEKGATYAEQGIFSLASWPFSLKILWAPIVDSAYFRSVGQRRSWLIPLQILVGLSLLYLSNHLGALISDKGSDVRTLAGIFFWIYALLASQDIAVDGWALTMLSRENVGLASTCNSVGQTAGFFVSFTGFLVLNAYGSVGLGGFITFWGAVFLTSALFVALKREVGADADDKTRESSRRLTVFGAYKQAFSIARLPSVVKLSAVLLTRAVAFSAAETLTQLKLLEKGVPKQHMATISALMTPVSVFLPVYVSRWTAGARPLDCVTATWMYRGFVALGASLVVLYVPANIKEVASGDAPIPWLYYACLYVWLSLYAGLNTTHFVAFMSFYSKVSDSAMGGTYMTLLNTVSNLGYKWCETATMFAIDAVSVKQCVGGGGEALGSCAAEAAKNACVAAGNACVAADGPFHAAVCLTPVVAFAWLRVAGKHIDRLQKGGKAKWKVRKSPGR